MTGGLAHAIDGQIESVGVVHQPVENGVGHRRVGDHFVPMFDVDLTGRDRAAASLPVIRPPPVPILINTSLRRTDFPQSCGVWIPNEYSGAVVIVEEPLQLKTQPG